MIKSLYSHFQYWSEKGSVYIISDPHFDDEDCRRINPNWPSPEEQVKIINQYATKSDTLIILGDIGDESWVRSLKAGYKVLIKGNHDKGSHIFKRRIGYLKNHTWIEKDNKLFDEIYEGALIIGERLILSHYPINLPYMSCIHGHTHNAAMRYENEFGCKCLCVAADVCNWTPINLGQEIKNGLLAQTPSIHRNYIDNHIGEKNN